MLIELFVQTFRSPLHEILVEMAQMVSEEMFFLKC